MRDLTPEECEFIAGGKLKKLQTMSYADETDPGEIVITATPPPPPPYIPPPPPPPYNPPVPNGPGGGGGGSSGGGYSTAGVSAAANAFADAHIQNNLTSAKDIQHYHFTHDEIAKAYDWLKAHPNAMIDIGKGHEITASEALSAIDNTQVIFTNNATLAGANGAQNYDQNEHGIIYINPENANTAQYDSYTNGENYQLWHEYGHIFDYFNNRADMSEASANNGGRSIQQQMGEATTMYYNGIPVPTPVGYD